MLNWYDVIKDQWSWGVYASRSDLDIYVKAGWITSDQADEIAGVNTNTTSNTVETTK